MTAKTEGFAFIQTTITHINTRTQKNISEGLESRQALSKAEELLKLIHQEDRNNTVMYRTHMRLIALYVSENALIL